MKIISGRVSHRHFFFKMKEIWLEKYRPKLLDDVVGNTQIISRLQSLQTNGNMPHILLVGPPGTGKTTSILALARSLLGSYYKHGVIELNASDDRGIDVVRDRIKGFAREKVELPDGKHKIIILDEVDSMTESAQQALRRLMEVYSNTTRFALACNQSTKIIDPIQSRCAIIRFTKLKDADILKRLKFICEKENVVYEENGLETLILTAEGDMRNAINNLQSAASGFGIINRENVIQVCDMPPPETITEVIRSCLSGDWNKAHTLGYQLFEEGIMKTLLRRLSLAEIISLEYLKLISRYQFNLLDGVNSKLQFDALLASLCSVSIQICDTKERMLTIE
ncbi:probable replication factor C subunit 2 isoform X2 [Hylaeus volcanicus]|uniref:probable replication factor C subunit 2 isoform X2 n=1 Tax=Hylaeus volcanicus TaxID=313075 RepID=UPI0023B7C386|nr:probable replication factor C subunit 2 isoform X2 [Hylaeus volcanicus]